MKRNLYVFARNSVPHVYGTKAECERALKTAKRSGEIRETDSTFCGKFARFSVL